MAKEENPQRPQITWKHELRRWASTEAKGYTKNIWQSLVAYGKRGIGEKAQGPCKESQIRDSHIKNGSCKVTLLAGKIENEETKAHRGKV